MAIPRSFLNGLKSLLGFKKSTWYKYQINYKIPINLTNNQHDQL